MASGGCLNRHVALLCFGCPGFPSCSSELSQQDSASRPLDQCAVRWRQLRNPGERKWVRREQVGTHRELCSGKSAEFEAVLRGGMGTGRQHTGQRVRGQIFGRLI